MCIDFLEQIQRFGYLFGETQSMFGKSSAHDKELSQLHVHKHSWTNNKHESEPKNRLVEHRFLNSNFVPPFIPIKSRLSIDRWTIFGCCICHVLWQISGNRTESKSNCCARWKSAWTKCWIRFAFNRNTQNVFDTAGRSELFTVLTIYLMLMNITFFWILDNESWNRSCN